MSAMKTPQKVSPSEFVRQMVEYNQTLSPFKTCPKCESEPTYVKTWISLHASEMGDDCTGFGQVVHLYIPHCPNCEEQPEISGCLHVPVLIDGSMRPELMA